MASKVQNRAAGESLLFMGFLAGILILLNVITAYLPVGRLDLTENKLFSLAPGSKEVVANLEGRMEIVGYFTEDLPPPFNTTERQVRDLLSEYEVASKGNLTVRFVNPDNEERKQQAQSDGVRPVQHQNVEKDQVSVTEGYRGLAIKYLDQNKAIPLIRDTSGLEYLLTNTIKEITGEKRPIGVLIGHEGPTLEQGLSRLKEALPTYDLKEVDAAQEIDPGLAALLVIEPKTALSETELRRIDQYVMNGGSLGIFGGSINLDLQQAPAASPLDTGINQLLKPWGVQLQSNVVADALCGRAPMRGPFGMQVLVPYPPIPVINISEEQAKHPVMFKLSSPMIPFASVLSLQEPPPNVKITSLADSTEQSWAISGTQMQLQPRNPQEWQSTPEVGPFTLMVAIEGQLPSAFGSMSNDTTHDIETPALAAGGARVLVSGSSTFVSDAFMPPTPPDAQVQMSTATSLALNAVDWLAAEDDLMAIRAKTIEDPALNMPDSLLAAQQKALTAQSERDQEALDEALEEHKAAASTWDKKKARYRWLNGLGIPLAFALFGLGRWRWRRARRSSVSL